MYQNISSGSICVKMYYNLSICIRICTKGSGCIMRCQKVSISVSFEELSRCQVMVGLEVLEGVKRCQDVSVEVRVF